MPASPADASESARAALVHDVVARARPLVLNSARIVDLMWRADGLTAAARTALDVLVCAGPLPVPILADRLDLPRQAVQRQVDDLVELGLIDRRPNPDHRRSVLLTATERGRDLHRRIRHTEHRQLGRSIAPEIDDADLRTAARVLAALNRDIRERAHLLRTLRPGGPGAQRG